MNSQNVFKLGLLVVLTIVLIGAAFAIGYQVGNDSDVTGNISSAARQVTPSASEPTSTLAPAVATITPKDASLSGQIVSSPEDTPAPAVTQEQPEPMQEATLTDEEALRVLREVWDLVDSEFYGDLPTPEDRTYGAIRGMLETLGDDYTSFLEPSIAEIERTDASGRFEGIGALVRMNEEGILEIVRPFEGQPAAEAGLHPGDMVLAVDGQSVVGYSIYEAITLIRGPKGTEVVLTIQRDLGSEPFDVSIVRARIEIPIVESQMIEQDIGYVSLFEFSSQATAQLEDAIAELLDQGATALIFDLRDNPGGFLDQAVRVSDLFLDEGVVLIERISDGQVREFTTSNKGLAQDIPLVVLVNSGSASASEIVAGAIQDRDRAALIGETTFGKGSVQLPHTLSDGSELRVTIARWFTPNDRAIHGKGLEPNVLVPALYADLVRVQGELDKLVDDFARGTIDQAQFDELAARYQEELAVIEKLIEEGFDPQLDRALEYLQTGQ